MEVNLMTFKPNDYNEIDLLNDSYLNTSKRTQSWLKKSWAEPFSKTIFPAINEERFQVLYHEDNGRPPTPINDVLGALIIKELQSLTDEDLKLRCHTDLSIQHALHSTSWEEQLVSERTVSRFRRRCYLYELETGIDLIQEEMIASNTRNLSRLELLYTCIERLVRKIEKDYPSFDVSEYQRYLDSSHENEFIYHSDQPYNDKMQDILLDAFGLNETFESTLKEDTDFQLLCCVMNEQTTTDEDGHVSLKKGKEISPTSLQTPVEP